MTFDEVCALALAWPGVEQGTSYRTPALKVKGKLIARLKEDGDSLVVPGVGFDEREMLMTTQPEVFYITDHYRDWPSVLVRLSAVHPETITRMLRARWRDVAPRKLMEGSPAHGRGQRR